VLGALLDHSAVREEGATQLVPFVERDPQLAILRVEQLGDKVLLDLRVADKSESFEVGGVVEPSLRVP
jgi:hypothetical protein